MKRPLDTWLENRIAGLKSCEDLQRWQLARLSDILRYASSKSRYYRKSLKKKNLLLKSYSDLENIPFTTGSDLSSRPEDFLCGSQDQVARVVSLHSSGTTGSPKRIFYSADDLELTREFFAYGMQALAGRGSKVLVLLPGNRNSGVTSLLCEALSRFGAFGLAHGPVCDPAATVDLIQSQKVSSIVGSPAQLNVLASLWSSKGFESGMVKTVLLCWDTVPEAVRMNVEQAFGCRVFTHWGMVETGLGGAVECEPGSGMHIRAPDILVEIVDPVQGRRKRAGEWGEIVVSTLSRQAMPLIRYRTGDLGRLISGRCSCGSLLPRLELAKERTGSRVQLMPGKDIVLNELSEVLYKIQEVADFKAEFKNDCRPLLCLTICPAYGCIVDRAQIELALREIRCLKDALQAGRIGLKIGFGLEGGPADCGHGHSGSPESGLSKRTLC